MAPYRVRMECPQPLRWPEKDVLMCLMISESVRMEDSRSQGHAVSSQITISKVSSYEHMSFFLLPDPEVNLVESSQPNTVSYIDM